MWSMWNAPSDRDYYDQGHTDEPDEDPEEVEYARKKGEERLAAQQGEYQAPWPPVEASDDCPF